MKLKDMSGTVPEYKGKGKILRIKEGYNPNSSSLGSVVFSVRTVVYAVPVLFSAAAGFLYWAFTGSGKKEKNVRENHAKGDDK